MQFSCECEAPGTVLSRDAPSAKQPPDAPASHHHEQNRQCNCSCKHCDYCCERKDVHNAIRKCEKHAFPLDGKSPSRCWPGQVKQSEATLEVRPSPLCTRRAEHFFEALTEFPGPDAFFGQGPQPAFAFAGRRISICRAAMTPEQEKALHDALDRLAGELATLKIMLRRLRADVKSHPSKGTASQILSLSPLRLAPQSKCLAP